MLPSPVIDRRRKDGVRSVVHGRGYRCTEALRSGFSVDTGTRPSRFAVPVSLASVPGRRPAVAATKDLPGSKFTADQTTWRRQCFPWPFHLDLWQVRRRESGKDSRYTPTLTVCRTRSRRSASDGGGDRHRRRPNPRGRHLETRRRIDDPPSGKRFRSPPCTRSPPSKSTCCSMRRSSIP